MVQKLKQPIQGSSNSLEALQSNNIELLLRAIELDIASSTSAMSTGVLVPLLSPALINVLDFESQFRHPTATPISPNPNINP